MAREVHLWREYPTAPFQRFAMTIRQADTPDHYEVVDHDPAVASALFVAMVQQAMTRPVLGGDPDILADGTIVERTFALHPGDPGYVAAAARTLAQATVRGIGRGA